MWNVYQYPWLLLLAAFCAFLIIGTFRCVFPDKLRLCQWVVPLIIAGIGLGLDYCVQTDLEKVRTVLATLLESAQIEDVNGIVPLIAEDYQDSYHASKSHLINHLYRRLANPVFEKVTRLSRSIDPIEGSHTAALLNLTCVFDPNSDVARAYRSALFAEVKFNLTRQSDGDWKISRVELLEVDKQPLAWSDAVSQF